MKNKIDVVIPTLGEPRRLSRLLTSMENCDLACVENVYLVYNGRREPDRNVATSRLPIVMLRSPVQGVNSARDFGWRTANCEILLFLDDDCEIIDPQFFRKHLAAHGQYPEAAAIGGPYQQAPDQVRWSRTYSLLQTAWCWSGVASTKTSTKMSAKASTKHLSTTENPNLLGGNISYKKSGCAGRGFNTAIRFGGAEAEFHRRLHAAGKMLLFCPELFVRHHVALNFFSFARRAFWQGYHNGRYQTSYCREEILTKTELAQTQALFESSKLAKAAELYQGIFSIAQILGSREDGALTKLRRITSHIFAGWRRRWAYRMSSIDDRLGLLLLAHDRKKPENGTSSIDLNISK